MFTREDALPLFTSMAHPVLWDDDKIFQLIELFESKHILWDCTSKEYKNKSLKNVEWEQISKVMGIPKADIENKIHILRTQLTRERKRLLSLGGGVESKWKFYEPLKFLFRVTLVGGGADAMGKSDSDVVAENGVFNETERPTMSPTTSSYPQPAHQTHSSVLKKRKLDNHLSQIMQLVKSAKREVRDENGAKDEFDIYGQYVASELRSGRNANAVLLAKSYINNILIEMRLGKYDDRFESQHENAATSASEEYNKNLEEFVIKIEPNCEPPDDS